MTVPATDLSFKSKKQPKTQRKKISALDGGDKRAHDNIAVENNLMNLV